MSQARGFTGAAQASVPSSESEAPAAAPPPARAHTLVGAFSSAFEPGSPFSVLSFPEELTRHSFLGRERAGEGEVVRARARVRGQLQRGAVGPATPPQTPYL